MLLTIYIYIYISLVFGFFFLCKVEGWANLVRSKTLTKWAWANLVPLPKSKSDTKKSSIMGCRKTNLGYKKKGKHLWKLSRASIMGRQLRKIYNNNYLSSHKQL